MTVTLIQVIRRCLAFHGDQYDLGADDNSGIEDDGSEDVKFCDFYDNNSYYHSSNDDSGLL